MKSTWTSSISTILSRINTKTVHTVAKGERKKKLKKITTKIPAATPEKMSRSLSTTPIRNKSQAQQRKSDRNQDMQTRWKTMQIHGLQLDQRLYVMNLLNRGRTAIPAQDCA